MNILIIEDDNIILREITKNLEKWDYKIFEIRDFNNIIAEVKEYNPNLILLDISLPYYDGFYWCKKIREFSSVPIMFISSKSDKLDMIMAMNLGGDDYITKPFDMDLLITKIRALLRRTYSFNDELEIFQFNDVTLDINRREILFNDNSINLTQTEFVILKILFEKANSYVSKDEIITRLWSEDAFVDDNVIAVNINRIRNKFKKSGIRDIIKTKKGIGYGLIEGKNV
ncbi:response regulator transcription factor [Miniphocaeibacter halophilus]|uniref:Response regulator transcription factor n=1 Tax=Miniphocaeibacter halophilus TaxID=2931922 RepID=A0AC61MTI9_9FIRM|nr:response regulator transcription factor [Miniphocaeibacter halophilus]QQK09040.1 response regulator transcription factor [Miniphocaeibacter halophilus]